MDIGHSCLCLLLISFILCPLDTSHSGTTYRLALESWWSGISFLIYLPIFLPSGEAGLLFFVYSFADSSIKGAPQRVGLSNDFEEQREKSLNVCPEGQVSQSGAKGRKWAICGGDGSAAAGPPTQ